MDLSKLGLNITEEQLKQIIWISSLVLQGLFSLLCAILVIRQCRKNRVLEKVTGKVRGMLGSERSDIRLLQEEELQRREGNREKKKLLYRLDELLIHSGVKKVLPFMTTELMITLVMILAIAVFVIVLRFTNELMFATGAGIASAMLIYAVMRVLKIKNKARLEDEILQFANLLENYSRTTDDIVSIFGKIVCFLNNPLQTAVSECYSEISSSGDIRTAFARLDAKIGHRQFSDLLSNIEICSRHETNYEDVIKGNKKIIKNYLAEKAIRGKMTNNARLQIATLYAISVFIVSSINKMVEGNLLTLLMSGLVGRLIITYCVGITLFSLWKCITMGQEEV